MSGLWYKDWSTLFSHYKRNLLFLVIVYLGMALLLDLPFMLYALVFLLGVYVQSSVSFDERSRWDLYAHTLPVSPAAIVGSKYLLGLAAIASGFALGLVAFLFSPGVARGTMGMGEAFVGMLAAAVLTLLYVSLSLPLSYRYGSERARIIVMLLVLFLAVLVIAFAMLLSPEQVQGIQRFFGFRGPDDIWDPATQQIVTIEVEYGSLIQWMNNLHFWWLVGGTCLASLAVFLASWAVSILVYQRKQF